MRLSKILFATVAVSGVILAGLATSASAGDENYTVAGGGGTVTLKAKPPWHVNKQFPWRATCGATVLTGPAAFTLRDTEVVVTGGTGSCELKGALCAADKCEPFKTNVTF